MIVSLFSGSGAGWSGLAHRLRIARLACPSLAASADVRQHGEMRVSARNIRIRYVVPLEKGILTSSQASEVIKMPWPKRGPQHSDFCPYFESLRRMKRICPECHSRVLQLRETLNPNGALEFCDCGYFQGLTAPKAAQVPWDGKTPWRNPKRKRAPKVIKLDFDSYRDS